MTKFLFFTISLIIVHLIKATRLYLILYGNGVKLFDHIKTYCKVMPVSIILPYKLGEFFRIYCYGKLLKNYTKSAIIILLDRFVDTFALVSIILLFCLFSKNGLTNLVYLLIIFLLFLLFLYKIFPDLYKFWKKYYLSAKATKRKLLSLKYLERINNGYLEIKNVIQGKGVILCILSIMAWSIEILILLFLSKANALSSAGKEIGDYLFCALKGSNTFNLSQFAFFSIVFFVILYLILEFYSLRKAQK